MTEDDCILHDLKLQEAYATNWIISAKQVCNTGSDWDCSFFLLKGVFLEMSTFSLVFMA